MRRTAALLLVALVLVVACGDDGAGDGATSSTTTAPDLPGQVAVFGPDDVETDVYGNEVTWTPGPDEVAEAEVLLADRLAEEALAGRGVDELGTYARQYAGIGTGDEQVTVNALCAVDDIDWQDEYVVVADGGPCFWQATVDLTTATIAPFTVNGSA